MLWAGEWLGIERAHARRPIVGVVRSFFLQMERQAAQRGPSDLMASIGRGRALLGVIMGS